MAPFYAMAVPEFAAELGLPGRDVFDLEWHLSEGEGALITARAGLTPEVLKAMMFRGFISDVRMMIARKNRYRCPACLDDVHRKLAALPWRFRCPVHGVELRDATGATLREMLGAERTTDLEATAKAGADVLEAWARGEGQGALSAPAMLAVLTTRHRRASPPSVAEQPRMSL
jgi:hypothetical protein